MNMANRIKLIKYSDQSNFVSNFYISDKEMREILSDKELIKDIKKALQDIKKNKYDIVA